MFNFVSKKKTIKKETIKYVNMQFNTIFMLILKKLENLGLIFVAKLFWSTRISVSFFSFHFVNKKATNLTGSRLKYSTDLPIES